MDRENDKKIAAWLGWKVTTNIYGQIINDDNFYNNKNKVTQAPFYSIFDHEAITLFPALVERGYQVELANTGNGAPDSWGCWIFREPEQAAIVKLIGQASISRAISGAVLQLIESI